MEYTIKKIQFNSFQERLILETDVKKDNFCFESRIELPIDALNRLINSFQQCFSSVNFYDILLAEEINEDVYYNASFQQIDWKLDSLSLESLKARIPKKICA
ncbi:MAG: hypothetical protein ACKO5W_04450 [Crocinitomicaceae bacterium]